MQTQKVQEMDVVGALGKNTDRVRDVLQDHANRLFFGVNPTIPFVLARGGVRWQGTFSVSDLWSVILRHAIQSGVLRGFKLRGDQHPKTSVNLHVKSEAMFVQRDDRWCSEPVALTWDNICNRQIEKRHRFARMICSVTAYKGHLPQLISEISRLRLSEESFLSNQSSFKPDAVGGNHCVLGAKKNQAVYQLNK
mgnify:CR=1 FL=1